MSQPPPARPSWKQILLGMFILWQIGHLAVMNLIRLYHRGARDPWANLTGLYQQWWEFDDALAQAPLAAVELRWDNPPRVVRLRSRAAPADTGHYAHGFNRARWLDYEGFLVRYLFLWTPDTINERHPRYPLTYRESLAYILSQRHRPMEAYLRQRWRDYLSEHPGTPPPDALVLIGQQYFIPPPPGPDPWEPPAPFEVPIVRLRPEVPPPAGRLALEMYDPARQEFVPVAESP